jgi:hypothetical protein
LAQRVEDIYITKRPMPKEEPTRLEAYIEALEMDVQAEALVNSNKSAREE